MGANDAARLTVNLRKLTEYGKSPGREIAALERNVDDALHRMQGYLNDVLTAAVFEIGNRSPVVVLEARRGTFTLLGGKSVIPVNLVNTFSDAGTCTLPARVKDLNVMVKDSATNAATLNISITAPEPLVLIDNSASPYVINMDDGFVWLHCDGDNWWRLAS